MSKGVFGKDEERIEYIRQTTHLHLWKKIIAGEAIDSAYQQMQEENHWNMCYVYVCSHAHSV